MAGGVPLTWDTLAERLARGAQERCVADLAARMAGMLRRGVENPDELGRLHRVCREEAVRVWAERRAGVTAECRAAFGEVLAAEDERVVAALGHAPREGRDRGLTGHAENRLRASTEELARSIVLNGTLLAASKVSFFNLPPAFPA